MQKVNYFIPRILFLLFFLVVVSLFYQYYLYPKTIETEGWLKIMGEKTYSKKPDIIYFSASPNRACFEGDLDKRSIAQKIQSYLKVDQIEAMDTGAIHAGIFLHALQQMPTDYKPKLIVMDLNLRSFGNMWIQSGLENSLQRNLVYWNNYPGIINRIRASLKNYSYIPYHERSELIQYDEKFKKLPFKDSCQTIKKWTDSIRNKPNFDPIGAEMVIHFGFKIDKNNQMLLEYDKIVNYCKSKQIPIIFLILPENLEGMSQKAGENLKKLCLQNTTFLQKHFFRTNSKIINDVDILNASYFFEDFPTEHYKSDGREKVAKSVARQLNYKLIKTKNQ
jgi:hypothetical protein